MILHLLTASEWAGADAPEYRPESLATDGFIHCSADDDLILDVANHVYRDSGEVLVLSIDEHDLAAELRWEAPHPTPPDWPGTPLYPHLYGALNLDAVVGVRRLVHDASGRFVGYERA